MSLKRFTYLLSIFLLVALFSQCANSEIEQRLKVDETQSSSEKRSLNQLSIHDALPKVVKSPSANLASKEKIELGRLLFYDPILSGDKDVACATCHHPNNGYAEYRDLSIGVNGKGLGSKRTFNQPNEIPFVKRNAHTILNTAFNGITTSNTYDPESAPMFWDTRVTSLEKQAIVPILAFEEMRGTHLSESEIMDSIVNRLNKNPAYVKLFESAFDEFAPVNEVNLAKAIAAFERTLVTSESRFDQYMRGDKNAISNSEEDGFLIFKKAGCGNCHNGPMFSDYLPHVLGVPHNTKLAEFDKGIDDQYAFRTASLRNLRFTSPYMHNGKFNTLKEVLEFYEDIENGNNLHTEVERQQLDTLINEIKLSVKEIGPIISFLNTLNDSDFDKEIPKSVPSGLVVGGNINE